MVLSKDTLRDTHDFLSSLSKKKEVRPSDLQLTYYILAKEFGFSIKDLEDLPITYIIGLLNSHNYIKKEEEKAHKQANKK